MLCVVQLGNGTKDSLNPPTVARFLNMLDLFASWSYANIDRLVTDSGGPHDWCEYDTDPWDNTQLSIDVKRLFLPHTTSFAISEGHLDQPAVSRKTNSKFMWSDHSHPKPPICSCFGCPMNSRQITQEETC
ncbi:hypothetical protein METBIDRAFT_101360 [Metschnikowia bicuspidata var. bicuspidata NRRL YB-4993]|uniref:Bul1 N-terminal domain-containing protein n=1 Tax=Metschnikowia bicuspidata var. bicuspidata NRRL YB-4993 TaxID=869754 RepID=A0A1A0HGQ3_9ASCO|nr:hypothetical protein METBIDRAFT_101360 [Metschnikowia bicuspidata var. bicuspidata NRRL YB-4993]OBA23176.1 hypothetical protein METBIDRAFT_101360 [Metschnikowia bicuspidata var. bicuspidata NRRL YB-4993]